MVKRKTHKDFPLIFHMKYYLKWKKGLSEQKTNLLIRKYYKLIKDYYGDLKMTPSQVCKKMLEIERLDKNIAKRKKNRK